jgi:hypothetical protein
LKHWLHLFTLCLLAGSCLLLGAADPEEAAPVPSFRAGAEVTLGITFNAPQLWVINPGIPFHVTFDKEQLKSAPFKVDKPLQDFKLKNYVTQVYIELPVKLNKDLADGEVKVPFHVDCGICTADQSQCTVTGGDFEARVVVLNSAAAGTKEQALKRGTAPSEYRLPLP